jgi:hypothetical protein
VIHQIHPLSPLLKPLHQVGIWLHPRRKVRVHVRPQPLCALRHRAAENREFSSCRQNLPVLPHMAYNFWTLVSLWKLIKALCDEILSSIVIFFLLFTPLFG